MRLSSCGHLRGGGGAAEFLREDMVEASPMVWLIQVDGFVLDARHVPVEIQVQAFEKGIIPYIPALGPDGTAAFLDEIGNVRS